MLACWQLRITQLGIKISCFASFIYSFTFSLTFTFPACGQAMVSGVVPFPPGTCLKFLSRIASSIPTARRLSSSVATITHAFAISASQFVHKKKSLRIYTRMHSGGIELTKLTYSRHEDNLLRRRGDRLLLWHLKCRINSNTIQQQYSFCGVLLFSDDGWVYT